MGQDSIRYLLFLCGRWRWRPTRTMRKYGFRLITFGRELTPADKARAIALNDEWDKVRAGQQPLAQAEAAYAPGTIGHGYERAVKLRAAQWASQGIKRTAEQAKRDDWSRAWRWLGPTFGHARPHDIRPEHFLSLNAHGEAIGLLPKIEARVSKTERHRVVKVWRALWKKLATFGCVPDGMKDPSLAFSNTAPEPRQAVWAHREVMLLVQRAWRMEYRGLAALIAVSWDTMFVTG